MEKRQPKLNNSTFSSVELFNKEASDFHLDVILKFHAISHTYYPKYLHTVHVRVVESLAKVYEKDEKENYSPFQTSLRKNLLEQYKLFHTERLNQLQQQWMQIKKMIQKHKSIYEEEMDILLDKGNINVPDLHEKHLFLASEALRTFKSAIIDEIGEEEPVISHLNSLWIVILKSYEGFYQENCSTLGLPSDDFETLAKSMPKHLTTAENTEHTRSSTEVPGTRTTDPIPPDIVLDTNHCDEFDQLGSFGNDRNHKAETPELITDADQDGLDLNSANEGVTNRQSESGLYGDSNEYESVVGEDIRTGGQNNTPYRYEGSMENIEYGDCGGDVFTTIGEATPFDKPKDENIEESGIHWHRDTVMETVVCQNNIMVPADTNQRSKETFDILYQISLFDIQMVAIPCNNLHTKNITNLDPLSYKAQVGLMHVINGKDKWLCGKELEAEESCCVRIWPLKNCLANSNFEEQIDVNGSLFIVYVDFLLAILMYRMKSTITGSTSRALVSVPSWFTCVQRQQIVNAASMAGFEYCQLYNEYSCCAFYNFMSNKTSCSDLILATENSNRTTVAIVSFDRSSKTQTLKGLITDEKTTVSNGNWLRFGNCLADPNPAKRKLEKLCKLARISPHDMNRLPILICNSKGTSDTLTAFRELDSYREGNFEYRNEYTIKGLAQISMEQNCDSLNHFETFKETLPFEILVHEGKLLICTVESRCLDFQFTIAFKTHANHDTLTFSQKNALQSVTFGTLVKTREWSERYNDLYFRFSIDFNGILQFSVVEYSIRLNGCRIMKKVPFEAYHWFPIQLAKMQIDAFKKVVGRNTYRP